MARHDEPTVLGDTDSASRIDSAPRSLEPGTILLDRYRVERILGQGGMGTVVAARHIELNQLVAFKFLRGEAQGRADVVERFMREARALAKLQSEHVTRVFDVGTMPTGEPFMLMEHLMGRDLDQVLEQEGRLDLARVITLALELCDALADAHSHGIVHRDLKPANLFLHTPARGKSVLKVLDFGISKQLAAERTKLTSTHALLGSPLYMSPEQALKPQLVDTRSDLWAVGVVLHELATGAPPFTGESVPEVVAQILEATPSAPSSLRPELPAWFDAIVQRCLHKVMEKRFQNVAELRAELERGASELSRAAAESAPPASTPPELEPAPPSALRVTTLTSAVPVTRPRRSWWGLLAAAGLVLVATLTSFLLLRPTPPAPRQASSEANGSASLGPHEASGSSAHVASARPPEVTLQSATQAPTPTTQASAARPSTTSLRPARSASPTAPQPAAARTHDPLDTLD